MKKFFFFIFIAIGAFCLFAATQKSDISEAQSSGCAAPADSTGLRVFVTSGDVAGASLSSDAAADQICQNFADAAGIQGTYNALVYLGSRNPTSVLKAGRTFWVLDRNGSSCTWHEVAPDNNAFFSGNLLYPINFDENGAQRSTTAWTNFSIANSKINLLAADNTACCNCASVRNCNHNNSYQSGCSIANHINGGTTDHCTTAEIWGGSSAVADSGWAKSVDKAWIALANTLTPCNTGNAGLCTGSGTKMALYCVQQLFCKPGSSSGCHVCNSSGSAFNDDSSRCLNGQTCQNGACIAPCTNACTSGLKQCNGNGYQTCSDSNQDGCTEWSSVTACGSGQNCSAGSCTGSICTPNCSNKNCGSDGCGGFCGTLNGSCISGQTCSDSGTCINATNKTTGSACSTGAECASGVCTNNICVAPSTNKTTGSACSTGAECASGVCTNNICAATCASMGYVCGSWSNGSQTLNCGTCPSGQTCSGSGTCVAGNCTTHSTQKCNGGNLYWYDSCGTKEDLYKDCSSNQTTSNYQCSGNELQKQTIASDCVNNACTSNPTWINVQDCSASGQTCSQGVCVAKDNQAPVISSALPSGNVYVSKLDISVTTNEPAACRFADTNIGYDRMTMIFASTDKLHHTATLSLGDYGAYDYYVLCRDDAQNTSPVPGRVKFTYVSSTPSTTSAPPASSGTAPVISGLSPSSDVHVPSATLACATDEESTCKYDTKDVAYSSMKNTMQADSTGTQHSQPVTLTGEGPYNYYVRCKSSSGIKDTKSAQISFNYSAKVDGPAISNPTPTGQVFQKDIALMVTTDKQSTCRYSTTDQDYDPMPGTFSSADGLQQTASVSLAAPGTQTYYVRCADAAGNKDDTSTTIAFEYVGDSQPALETGSNNPPGQNNPASGNDQNTAGQATCSQVKTGDRDGVCDNAADCVCDPDCGANGQPEDPDCIAVTSAPKSNTAWLVAVLVGLPVVVIGVIAAIFILAKRKGGQEDVEETDADNEFFE